LRSRLVQPVQVQQRRAQDAHRIRVPGCDLYRALRMGQRTGVVFHPPQHAGQVHMRFHEIGLQRDGLAVQAHGGVQVAGVLQAKAVVQQRGAVARVEAGGTAARTPAAPGGCCWFSSSSARRVRWGRV
jgi:hypothetical protein